MNWKLLITTVVLATTSFVTPVKSQEPTTNTSAKLNQVLNACIQNQAETLPNPFTDVPSDHWAFKAVMTMHYCGAFRKATPPALFQKLQPTNSQQQPQKEPQLQK
ncbi:S-layer protein [Nostoc sp. FACHB-888]|uniref:S-layer protein n=1 Tax=Nostoc sp. FACHB-888 TaxID=2692842 RepID=UPI00168756C9|nr:S-layer protein [Nostoc sp. FACHB-888]MBD2247130.1 S-layer protein [Nostoc sp. FACHB-888]MCC5648260.1 S-layer protein [Nostoc sp. XA013]